MTRLRLLICLATLSCLSLSRAQSREIEIGTLPGLRFDVKSFEVAPGEQVQISFTNDDDMLHNMVIAKPGTRETVVYAAMDLGGAGAEKGYVPDTEDVLWYTAVVASGTSVALNFEAPSEEGDYPFVCTYPGHGFVMFGTMRVRTDPSLVIEYNDDSLERQMDHSMHMGHTIVTRCFMPDAGPASVAVGLPSGYSYCWDAGAVRFRYAWKGGYGEQVYRKPMNLTGEVFYRENGGIPFRVGGKLDTYIVEANFLGYRLDEMGNPEFEYELDSVKFKERIWEDEGILHRRVSIAEEDAADGVYFMINEDSVGMVSANVERNGSLFRFPESGVLELLLSGKEGSNE